MTSYDENLTENKFFKFLLKNHYDLLKKASEDNWIVCIPCRCNNFTNITETDVYEHIILPGKKKNATYTLFKSKVEIEKNKIGVCREYLQPFYDSYDVKILFRETIYWKSLKLNAYCTDTFLNRSTFSNFLCIDNLRDSIDFLWEICNGSLILSVISEQCNAFFNQHNISFHDLKQIEYTTQVHSLYERCFTEALALRSNFNDEFHFPEQVHLSVGTYVQHCLNGKIFMAACYTATTNDIIINRKIRRYQFKKPSFNIHKFLNVIPKAKTELGKINLHSTCLGKLNCLKNVYNILNSTENITLGSDTLFELLLFLICKSNINNWYGNFIYLRNYGYKLENNLLVKNTYLITQLEGVLEYLKNTDVNITPSDIIENDNQLFQAIAHNNIDVVKALLKDCRGSNKISFCHPLCECKDCTNLLENNDIQNVYDNLGHNCLHIASIFGKEALVAFLIDQKVDINKEDSFGFTPIHYAAAFGNDRALIHLIYAGADLYAQNFDGNTALHLAVDFSNEFCTTYFFEYMKRNEIKVSDFINKEGNTVLHLAAHRNYVNIILILKEYNIDLINVRNKCDKLAVDLTSNVCVKRLLCTLENFNCNEVLSEVYSEDFSSTDNTSTHFFGIKPINTDQIKRTELLLKAIENNDLPLTCFYLGINVEKARDKLCHPLCNCKDCNLLYEESKINCESDLDINVCNMEGFTALHYAAKFGRKDIFLILLRAGAAINVLTYKTLYSPLHIACMNEQIITAKELLQVDACNVNMQDHQGNTALHYAVNQNNAKLVEALLKRGCNLCIKNCDYRTALDEAVDKSNFDIIKLIKGEESFFN